MSQRCTMCKSSTCKCTTQEKILKELTSLNKKMEILLHLTLANGYACSNDMASNPSRVSRAVLIHDSYLQKFQKKLVELIEDFDDDYDD